MDLWVLDQSENALAVPDVFKSAIWTDRYLGYGDFELYLPVEKADLTVLKEGNYLVTPASDRTMLIEGIEMNTDAEDGNYLTVTGRSLEAILERRIIWGHKTLTGNFQNGIKTLLNENVIAPSISARAIPNFVFVASSDPRITELTVDTQFLGENLYEAIYMLCEEKRVGFRVRSDGAGGFVFSLYCGEDRSYAQEENPWVIFSPDFENVLSSNYIHSSKSLKTATLVGGEGEGSARVLVETTDDDGGGSGLNRRETFTDASGVSRMVDSEEISDDEYQKQLAQKGKETLAETKVTESFEGQIDATRQFVYGTDFFLGDTVQISNEYGMEATVLVSEIVLSHDENGETFHPTFTSTVQTNE